MKYLKIAGIAALAGQIAAILFLLAAGVLLQKNEDPAGIAGGVSLAGAVLSGIVCGIAASRKNREGALLRGLLSGGLLALSTLALSLLPGKGQGAPHAAAVLLIQVLVPAALCFAVGYAMRNNGAAARRRRRSKNKKRKRA